MKRADMKVGATYAWTTSADGSYAKPVKVLDNERFHEQQTARFGNTWGAIVPSDRPTATKGNEYPYIQVGILVEHESGQQVLVNPAHIRETWAEWQARQAILAERRAETAARMHLEDVKAADTRRKLTTAIAESPWAKMLRTGHGKQTAVDNDVLLDIVESATSAATEFGWHLELPDEFVIDDDGPLTGIVRPAAPGDYDMSKIKPVEHSTRAGLALDTTYADEDVYPDA